MSSLEEKFLLAIRFVFLFAYGAFLWASIHHVAAYFSNFEPAGTGEAGSFALAIAVDGTALILAVGMMFFSRNMPWYAKVIVWFFILALTAFSWLVNWQYAVINQSDIITTKLDPMWRNLNPILASSFAFLNLAYSIVAEFFNTKKKTAAELQAELNELSSTASLKKQIRDKRAELTGPSVIERAKQTAIEAKNAAAEVMKREPDPKQTLPQNPVVLPTIPVEDKLKKTLNVLEKNTQISDEDLAKILHLNRPASARFWRLKAVEILQNNGLIFYQPTAQVFDQESTTPDQQNEARFDQKQPKDDSRVERDVDTGDLLENDLKQPITDPEIETVDLLVDDKNMQEHNTSDQVLQAGEEVQNSARLPKQDSPKKEFKGMLYRQAAKLPLCQQKNITAANIRSAVRDKKIRRYSDGSVSKSAVESWAKTFNNGEGKQPA
jgi:hypothetical protein